MAASSSALIRFFGSGADRPFAGSRFAGAGLAAASVTRGVGAGAFASGWTRGADFGGFRRGAGFGRALCETLLARARRDGATRLSLYVYRDNPSALGLYEALGWRRRRPPRHPLPAGLCYMVNDLTNVAPAADPG